MGRPNILTKEWLDEDRWLRFDVLESTTPELIEDATPVDRIIITFLVSMCNELQYMNDSRDKMDEPKRLQPAGFMTTQEDM